MPPCILFEDEHLLVVNKPAGWNTHAPAPYAPEGIYDWLRRRQPRWAGLALLHRLDKDTSGLLVFGKSTIANRCLSAQFESRQVTKSYRLLTDRIVPFQHHTVHTAMARAGERYVPRPPHAGAPEAITHFHHLESTGPLSLWEAQPETGLTHQVRVHAMVAGLPIIGDALYGGTTSDPNLPSRLCLHAETLEFRHPQTHALTRYRAPEQFANHGPWSLRDAFIDPQETDAYRIVHNDGDRRPGMVLERWGNTLLWQQTSTNLTPHPLPSDLASVQIIAERLGCSSIYHQRLERHLNGRTPAQLSPQWVWGTRTPPPWVVRENNVRYEIRFDDGYSVGLFLDQRENRSRLLRNYIDRDFPVRSSGLNGAKVLNLFAYTCGFSVCAALAGARTTSVDLARKALDWGQRNFRANGLNPADHQFLQGDTLDWTRRLARRPTRYDVILLDPPTFSRSKTGRVFRAEKDYGPLVQAVLPLLNTGGLLFTSTNTTTLTPERFRLQIESAVTGSGRQVQRRQFAPQPPDFPCQRPTDAHLKTFWMQIA